MFLKTAAPLLILSCRLNTKQTIPALVLIWVTQTLSPTIFEFRTWLRVQTGPYGCCLACPSGVLDDFDIWGQLRPILVLIGPDPVSVNLGRFEFLRRNVPGTPVEPSQTRKNKHSLDIIRCNAEQLWHSTTTLLDGNHY